jgi:ABC-type multidrug transport system permease subunit
MLLPLAKLSLIVGTVLPLLLSVAIFQVIDPGAHILRPVFVIVNALPVGSVVEELSLVEVTIQVIEGSSTVGLAIKPLAFIFSPVFPLLTAESVFNELLGSTITFGKRSEEFAHLTRIASAIWHCNVFNLNQLRVI